MTWSTCSTRTRRTNSARSRRSRPSSAPKPWGLTPRPTTSFWTPQILLPLRPPRPTSPIRDVWPFRERFAFWFMGDNGISRLNMKLCGITVVALLAPILGIGCLALAQNSPTASDTIPLTVPAGVPLHLALDKPVPIKHSGVPVGAHVVDPIFVFDHLVVPPWQPGFWTSGKGRKRFPQTAGSRDCRWQLLTHPQGSR